MQEILDRCAGLDVHKDIIVTCIMVGGGKSMYKEIRSFGTMTEDIKEMGEWLKSHNIEDAAMESTGIYWLPIFNVLDEDFNLVLANARNIKNVPGRKTDVKDSEWICGLFKNGLIEKSFIPPEDIRFLRNLTRYRQSAVEDLTSAKNRLIKILESANIKLASVFSSVYGKTAWNIIKMIAAGQDSVDILTADIPKNVKASKKQIRKALTGTIQEHHLDLLNTIIRHIESLEVIISDLENQVQEAIKPYQEQVNLLKTIPGIGDIAVATIIAEVGVDMNQFPTAKHLTSWAGIAPGNNESAGKKKSARINPGNNHLKRILIQSALAAIKNKATYYNAAFRRLIPRTGAKKAVVAIGRKILTAVYFVIGKNVPYKELGANFLDAKTYDRKVNYHKKQLENLGKNVILSNLENTIPA